MVVSLTVDSIRSASALQVLQNLPARVRARGAGDAAAGVRARAAEVEAAKRRAVLRPADEGAEGVELVERHLAVERVAARQAVLAFEVEGRDDLAAENQFAQVRRVSRERPHDRVGELLSPRV